MKTAHYTSKKNEVRQQKILLILALKSTPTSDVVIVETLSQRLETPKAVIREDIKLLTHKGLLRHTDGHIHLSPFIT